MSHNDIEIKHKEELTITISGVDVVKNLKTICKEFKKTRTSRPTDSHEEDLADDILRKLK